MGRIMFEKSWPIAGPRWKLDKIVVSMGDGQVKEFWREMSQKERQEAQKKEQPNVAKDIASSGKQPMQEKSDAVNKPPKKKKTGTAKKKEEKQEEEEEEELQEEEAEEEEQKEDDLVEEEEDEKKEKTKKKGRTKASTRTATGSTVKKLGKKRR